jgi:predicted transcriptional regulator
MKGKIVAVLKATEPDGGLQRYQLEMASGLSKGTFGRTLDKLLERKVIYKSPLNGGRYQLSARHVA